jgi:predicted nuclease of predicted toxin-antitoxin system
VRFLVDNALSPQVADALRAAGHDAIHVRDIGHARATDRMIVELAAGEDRVLVSADTDFATLLALRGERQPSFVLFRGPTARRPAKQARSLLEALPLVEGDLHGGAVVVLAPDRIRVRRLPVRD